MVTIYLCGIKKKNLKIRFEEKGDNHKHVVQKNSVKALFSSASLCTLAISITKRAFLIKAVQRSAVHTSY